MITVTMIGSDQYIGRLRVGADQLRPELLKTTRVLALALELRVKQALSGRVLNVRTGLLRSSINTEISETADRVSASVGTNVKYAAIHEFGGVIDHPGGTAYFLGVHNLAVFVGNKNPLSAKLPRTKPHKIPMPERSFLRSSLRELRPQIRDAYIKTIDKLIRGKKGP